MKLGSFKYKLRGMEMTRGRSFQRAQCKYEPCRSIFDKHLASQMSGADVRLRLKRRQNRGGIVSAKSGQSASDKVYAPE